MNTGYVHTENPCRFPHIAAAAVGKERLCFSPFVFQRQSVRHSELYRNALGISLFFFRGKFHLLP